METLKKYRHILLFSLDLSVVLVSYLVAAWFIPVADKNSISDLLFGSMTLCVLLTHGACFVAFRIYAVMWRYARTMHFLLCVLTNTAAEAILIMLSFVCGYSRVYPVNFFLVVHMISTLMILMSRLVYANVIWYRKTKNNITGTCEKKERLMVIGAGDMAAMFFDDLRRNANRLYDPVCIVDDDLAKVGHSLMGVKIMGTTNDIVRIVEEQGIEAIIFCIKNIDTQSKRRILGICAETNCHVLRMLIGVNDSVSYSIQKISIEDLLGRNANTLMSDEVAEFIGGKVVMVTGGGGSIGAELCRHIASLEPKKLIILDNYENNAYKIQQELIRNYGEKLDFETEIASVCDYDKMEKIFNLYRPNIVYHAAAHKHVSFMEHSPEEAVKNNIFGTLTAAKMADKFGVNRFVLVSTDKAVNPTNIMGATKRCCEMIVQSMDKMSDTEFVAVRFGNVLGSHGSVVPLFEEQILAGGPVTVTHPDIIRYFMTIPEAVQFLLAAGSLASGGEIFVLDMGEPVKIVDLATKLIKLSGLVPGKDIEIRYTGLRPGEKLYEELLLEEEGLKNTTHEKIFVGSPLNIDTDEFFSQLEVLRRAAYSNNTDEVVRLIAEIVPTYHRSDCGKIKK